MSPRHSMLVTEVTYFVGSPDDKDTYAVEVTWRGHGLYAVKRRSQVWNGAEWEYEPLPSSRTEDFIARTRFDFETASHHARALVRSAASQETPSSEAVRHA